MKLSRLTQIAIAATLLPVVSSLADSTPAGNVIVKKDIPYVTNGHVRQTLDLYLPAANHPVPLVVWVHGGAWKLGSKDWLNVKYLTEHGYAIASVDYRFSGDAKFPAQIQDCNTALNFLIANATSYGINPHHLIISGGSAGAHLALLLGLARNETAFGADPAIQPLAILDFFGPVDLLSMLDDTDQDQERAAAEDAFHRLLGASPRLRPDLARRASPINYVSPGSPPVLILHGDKDTSVPYRQSQRLRDRLNRAGVRNELITVNGVGHDGPLFATPALQEKVVTFLQSVEADRPASNTKP